ncbi:MAG TPA: phage minor head protein [Steroidobacteraceae bacterium]|nr:phage minor head protein [Steroidobacteraceae bacterium]
MSAASQRTIAELRVRRMMAQLAGRKQRRARRKIPEQGYPRASQLAYFQLCKRVIADLAGLITAEVLPQLPALLAQIRVLHPTRTLRTDAADDIDSAFPSAARVLFDLPVDLMEIARSVSVFNRRALLKQVHAGLGIDLLAGEPYLANHLELFVADNVRLITSVAETHMDTIRGIVMRAAREGTRASDAAKEIAARTDVSESRAQLIARDQIGSLNGELTQLRQESLGIERYTWVTSRDERVRDDHAELDGTTQSWDDPPVVNQKTGRTGHPGQDINCRCTASPVVDDLLEALGA